jgi:hypothetical protein
MSHPPNGTSSCTLPHYFRERSIAPVRWASQTRERSTCWRVLSVPCVRTASFAALFDQGVGTRGCVHSPIRSSADHCASSSRSALILARSERLVLRAVPKQASHSTASSSRESSVASNTQPPWQWGHLTCTLDSIKRSLLLVRAPGELALSPGPSLLYECIVSSFMGKRNTNEV